jgi:hypothetical protein
MSDAPKKATMETRMQSSDEFDRNKESSQSLGEQAQALRQDVKDAAAQAGEKVTDTLQEQASKIGDKARNVAADAERKIADVVDEQRASGASYLHHVAGLVHEAADVFDREVPQASQYIHRAAEHIDTLADAVRTKGAREVAHDVQNFARQQPAIFFGGALLLGFAAVRIFKASSPMSSGQREHVGQ